MCRIHLKESELVVNYNEKQKKLAYRWKPGKSTETSNETTPPMIIIEPFSWVSIAFKPKEEKRVSEISGALVNETLSKC